MLIGKSLVGHFVGVIMTRALAELHRRIFFKATISDADAVFSARLREAAHSIQFCSD
jgi:hypothetical protein